MKLQNRQLRKGLAMCMAALSATFLITSCSKDAGVTPQTTQPTSMTNTAPVNFTSQSLAATYTTHAAVSNRTKNVFRAMWSTYKKVSINFVGPYSNFSETAFFPAEISITNYIL